MHKALGWGFVLGFAFATGLACGGGSSGGSGGAGGGNPFDPDGGYLAPASYRPCLSNMECSAFESCSALYYYSPAYSYTTGICTRGCFDDSDCSGDVCVKPYAQTTSLAVRVCNKRCAATSDCRSGLICGDAGTCEVYLPPSIQSAACAQYVSCYYKTGGTQGSLDSSYGPNGTCWLSGSATAASCTSACQTAISSLRQAYPDAGC